MTVSVKSLQKQLIAAVAMVLVAMIALGSSTYAWFASNNKVDATGMTIAATSDAQFLIINTGDTFNAAGTETTVTTAATNIKLLPVAPVGTISSTNVETNASWHYAYSNDVSSSTKAGEYIVVGDGKTLTGDGNYLGKETFSIGLSSKSGVTESAGALQLQKVTLPANTGISCVVVCGTNAYTYTANDSTAVTLAEHATQTGSVVTVYYFINGDDTSVYTNNKTALTGTVALNFGIAA